MDVILQLFKLRRVRWSIAISWTVFITIILVQPEQSPVIPTGIPPGPNTLEREIFFTVLHLIAFSITCGVWFWTWFRHVSLSRSLIISVTISIVLGSITEYLQTFVPDRHPFIVDYLANYSGALFVAYLIWRNQAQIYIINKL